jgi:regulator of protease activity HflC (stomatin/prohibitin superfamily)
VAHAEVRSVPQEAVARMEAEKRARQEAQAREVESRARAEAEARLRFLDEELRCLRGDG